MSGIELTHEHLTKVINYNSNTGLFIWKVSVPRRKAGSVAGGVHKGTGYWRIRIDGTEYLGHRLAWFYHYGEWPRQLDHKDLDKLNNRITNLREATTAQNAANRRPKQSISGFKGVQKRPNNRWRAFIEISGKHVTIGTFGTAEKASEAYFQAAQKAFGEFARI